MIPRFSISLHLRNRSIPTEVPTLPTGVLWARALHDYESPEKLDASGRYVPDPPSAHYYRADLGYPVPRSLYAKDRLDDAKGFPEMIPGDPRVGVKLDRRLQWFWFKILVLAKTGVELVERIEAGRLVTFEDQYKRRRANGIINPDMDLFLKNAWRGLTKSFTAFTNQKGTDNCIDFIRGISNNTNQLPILWENTTGGALLRLESDRVYRQGYKILALNPADYALWKNWTPASHPGFFTEATNSLPFGFDGIPTLRGPWRVDRFHYLNGSPVFVPILSNTGYFYIRKNRIRIMREGDPFPPKVTNP
jgi:hypothetical protein